jgi:hypothetical protein
MGKLSASRLAVLPGTSHVGMIHRAEWLSSMVTEFLNAPMPERHIPDEELYGGS